MAGEAGAGDREIEIEDWDWEEVDRGFALPTTPTPTLTPSPSREREGSSGRRPVKPFARWTADTEQAFLLALRLTGQVRKAAAEIGRSAQAAYSRRESDPAFAAAWAEAVAAQQAEWMAARRERLGPGEDGAGGGRLVPGQERVDGWNQARRTTFLTTLARTKEVKAACDAAGMSDTAAYRLRGRSPAFARAWEKALMQAASSVLDAARARAVEGWDEPIVHGGQVVGTRKRYSDGLLRDLLRHEMAARPGGPNDPNAGRSTEAKLNEAILRNLAILGERRKREAAAAQEAEWGRACRTWGNWGRISAGEMLAEPPPEDPDADLDGDPDEDLDEDADAWRSRP